MASRLDRSCTSWCCTPGSALMGRTCSTDDRTASVSGMRGGSKCTGNSRSVASRTAALVEQQRRAGPQTRLQRQQSPQRSAFSTSQHPSEKPVRLDQNCRTVVSSTTLAACGNKTFEIERARQADQIWTTCVVAIAPGTNGQSAMPRLAHEPKGNGAETHSAVIPGSQYSMPLCIDQKHGENQLIQQNRQNPLRASQDHTPLHTQNAPTYRTS